MFTGFKIAGSGMAAQRVRINIVSSNIANSSTTKTEDGGPYKRQEALFRTTFQQGWDPTSGDNPNDHAVKASLRGVEVHGVQSDEAPGPIVWDPTHPDADAEGHVHMPNVNPVEEMVDMITASRSFEANAQAFQTLRDMMVRALDLGR